MPPMRRIIIALASLMAGILGGVACDDAARETGPASAAAPTTQPKTTTQPPTTATADRLAAPADLAAPPADAYRTASGLVTRVLKPASGDATPGPHDAVRVRYTGWKSSGKLIDSSLERGAPATFELSGVIPGWAEGLQLMRVGEKRRLWIPQALAYQGPRGAPRGPLVYELHLLEILE